MNYITRRVLAMAAGAVLTAAVPALAAEPLKIDDTFKPAASAPAAEQAPAGNSVRIGYVDMRKLATESVSGKKISATLKADFDKQKSRLSGKEKHLEKLKNAIEGKGKELTPEQRNARIKEFQKGLREFQEQAGKAEKELKAREAAETGKILERIEKVIASYGKSNGYAAIVAKGGFLYQEAPTDTRDLTDEIMKLIDAEPAP